MKTPATTVVWWVVLGPVALVAVLAMGINLWAWVNVEQRYALAIDYCILEKDLYWCDSENMNEAEKAECRRMAPLAATRPAGGIPANCKEKRDGLEPLEHAGNRGRR